MNVSVARRNECVAAESARKPMTLGGDQGAIDSGVEDAHWSDIAVEDDFGFGVRSSKEVS
jgi:hypothetical protein